MSRAAIGLPGRGRTAVRIGAWTVLAATMGVFAWIYLIAAVPPGSTADAVGQITYLVPHATTVALCLALLLRVPAGRERRFWGYLGVSSALLLCYESLYAYRAIAGLPETWTPWVLGAVLPLMAAAIFVLALTLLSRLAASSFVSRTRVLVDVALELVAVALMLFALLIEPVLAARGASPELAVFASVVCVAGLVIVGWSAVIVFGYKTTAWEPWERVVVAGVAIYGLGATLWPVYWVAAYFYQSAVAAHAVSALWMLGMGVVSVGAVYRLTSAPSGDLGFGAEAMPYEPPARPWFVPSLVASSVTIVGLWAWAGPVELGLRVLVGDAIVLLSLGLAVRSLLLVIEADSRAGRYSIDPVSGIATLTEFDRLLRRDLEHAARFSEPLTLVLIDIDRFREINDRYGHETGDRMLGEIGRALAGATSENDWVASRIDADEFGVMVPRADGVVGFKAALRLQMAMEHVARSSRIPFTASIAFAVFPDHGAGAPDLFRAAHDALDVAKTGEWGHILIFDPEDAGLRRVGEGVDRGSYMESIRVLARSVEARTPHEEGHGATVGRLARLLGRQLRLDEARTRMLEVAGELHDIGYLAVPDRVLEKPGRLDEAERRAVERHPEMGARVLASLDVPEILPWIRSHHERWDGRGYPRGLSGGEIPLGARILAVCDAFAAMTAERPYRRALRREEAIEELGKGRGSQFDPAVVDEFFFVLSSAAEGGGGDGL